MFSRRWGNGIARAGEFALARDRYAAVLELVNVLFGQTPVRTCWAVWPRPAGGTPPQFDGLTSRRTPPRFGRHWRALNLDSYREPADKDVSSAMATLQIARNSLGKALGDDHVRVISLFISCFFTPERAALKRSMPSGPSCEMRSNGSICPALIPSTR